MDMWYFSHNLSGYGSPLFVRVLLWVPVDVTTALWIGPDCWGPWYTVPQHGQFDAEDQPEDFRLPDFDTQPYPLPHLPCPGWRYPGWTWEVSCDAAPFATRWANHSKSTISTSQDGVTENWGIPWYTPIDPIAILIWKMISIGLGDSPLKPIDKARWFLLISPSPMDYVIYQSHNFFWSIMAKSMENDIPPFSNLPRLVFQVSWSFPRSHFFCVHRAGRSEGAELSCAAVKLR